MNEDEILKLLRDRLSISVEPIWGSYAKRLKVSLKLDHEEISSDEIDMSEIREDF